MNTCKHCGRTVVLDGDRWIDPEATGDDSVWRETCDEHDTFTAEHEVEPVEIVTTWADGFGRWNARVIFPGRGYGPQYLDSQIDRIRAKARRAIRRELSARETLPIGYRVRVEVAETHLDSMNVMHSITFRESVR